MQDQMESKWFFFGIFYTGARQKTRVNQQNGFKDSKTGCSAKNAIKNNERIIKYLSKIFDAKTHSVNIRKASCWFRAGPATVSPHHKHIYEI